MATSYKMQGNTLWVQLEGELDHHLAQQVKKKCQMMMVSNPVENIGFDFLKTDFMDSSGVGMIIGRYQEVQAIGGRKIECTIARTRSDSAGVTGTNQSSFSF